MANKNSFDTPTANRPRYALVKIREVQDVTAYGRTSIYDKVKTGEFPAPVKLGNGRSIAWKWGDIIDWLESRVAVRILEAGVA